MATEKKARMDTSTPPDGGLTFSDAGRNLPDLDPSVAGMLVAAAADIALVLEPDGTVRDGSRTADDLSPLPVESWVGKSWFDLVMDENTQKVTDLLSDPSRGGPLRWRQVTHRAPDGLEIPVRYATIALEKGGCVLAVGRSMRAMVSLQQRMVEAQVGMEREYARLRRTETRYRLLFQTSSEPVLIVDSATNRVVEANPAALKRLGKDEAKIVGAGVQTAFAAESREAVSDFLARVLDGTAADGVTARLAGGAGGAKLSGTRMRHDGAVLVLLRLGPDEDARGGDSDESRAMIADLIAASPEAFVATDMAGAVQSVNDAFLDMTQVGGPEEVKGRPIDRWLGRSTVDMNVLSANLKEHGSVRQFATSLRNEFGAAQDVEISAVAVPVDQPKIVGYLIRAIESRLPRSDAPMTPMARSIDQMSQLVGRVPLKDLVQESTDIIERLCIEAALKLTGDNRASAAEMLGLSRQSLYVKLRRHGVGQRDN
jgi:transcriptional regulator PpsR